MSRRPCTVRSPPRRTAILTARDYSHGRMRRWRRWWVSRTRSLIRSLEFGCFLRLAERREIQDVPVRVVSDDPDQVFEKIEAAFELLEFYGTRTLARLRKDTSSARSIVFPSSGDPMHRRTSITRAAIVSGAIAAFAGCASSSLLATSRPIDPGDAVGLGPNEGLLVVHVRTNVPIVSVDVGGVIAAEDVPEGTAVRLIGISAGTYRWEQIQVPGGSFVFSDHLRLRFRVDPGVINYVGMIDVAREGLSLRMDTLDRTSMALEQLRRHHPDLLASYPMIFSGAARNVFLERYVPAKAIRERETEQRDATRAKQTSAAAEALFRDPALLRVALNPAGTLSFTQGYNMGTQVVSVRSTRNATQTTVFSYPGPLQAEWEDDDTLFVRTGDGKGSYAIDLEIHEYGVVSRQHPIVAPGWLIDPLPLASNEVLWADWNGERSSVFRVPLTELERPTSGLKYEDPLPVANPKYEIVALSERALLWISDSHGVPRAA